MASKVQDMPSAAFPILRSVPDVRAWRKDAFDRKREVGFVPTMGALHEGHLELVRQSLKNCDETVCSIFVNPAQFAPTEDLSTYPRTLEGDLEKLQSLDVDGKKVSGLFLPSVNDLYPDGIEQDVSKQRGTFVDVVGFSQEMEGASRPTFFRGVATVVAKLFNIVQPDYAFFGQKDIQQCLILRRMLSDLHFAHPPSPLYLKIIPTVRDHDNLALSSRNAYLTAAERQYAPLLYHALTAAKSKIEQELRHQPSVSQVDGLAAATAALAEYTNKASADNVQIQLDYIKLNDPTTLQEISEVKQGQPAVLSGAVKIGKTRLIDNLLISIAL